MILHLLSEPKFDSLIISQMEECRPGENIFLFFSDCSTNNIKLNPGSKIIFKREIKSLNFSEIDGVIIHYLSMQKAIIIKHFPVEIPIAWSIWGADFYNFLPEFRGNLYSNLTKEYFKNQLNWTKLLLSLKINYLYFTRYHKLWKDIANKTKIFSTVIPYEKKLVENYFKPESKYFALPTYSIDRVIETSDYEYTIQAKECFYKNILIGNSGHPTNNHLEILHFFNSMKDETINVYAPLTYGDDKYIKSICKTGRSLLGEKFHPILNHLTNTEYLGFLNRFNIVVINSYRQQGIGTIIMALWCGGKVFLSNKNVTSSFYRDSGIKIFSVEDDLLNNRDSLAIFKPLTIEDILINRRRLLYLYSNEKVKNSVINFFKNLKD